MNASRLTAVGLTMWAAALPMALHISSVAAAETVVTGSHETYDDNEVVQAANSFFTNGAKDLGDVLGKVLKDKGKPVAFIRGEEAGGAIGVGLRYGQGEIQFKGAAARKVYWQGPSIGFDVGANAVKVFVLVYNLPSIESLWGRYPSAEGSLYFVGGFGVNYLQYNGVSLAPVRFGVGWRQGINLGYMNFSAEKRINPF